MKGTFNKSLLVLAAVLVSGAFASVAEAGRYLVRAPIETVRGFGVQVKRSISGTPLKVVELTKEQALRMAQAGFAVEPDQVVRLHGSQRFQQSWAMQMIRLPEAHATPGPLGEGVTVCVVDSGLDQGHPQIGSALVGGVNLSGEGERSDLSDGLKHGTLVASLIAGRPQGRLVGIAPRAQLYAVKIFNGQGASSLGQVIEGIRSCFGRAQVINMSFGGAVGSQALEDVLAEARERGISLIAAAGNDGVEPSQPASSPLVMAVGSVDRERRISPFSSRGPALDFVAPGEDVPVLLADGSEGSVSGTSFSAAFVTGVEVLRLSRQKEKLAAVDLGLPVTEQGAGLIDALLTIH